MDHTRTLKTNLSEKIVLVVDCRLWNIFSENVNFSQDHQRLQQLRGMELRLGLFAVEVALIQIQNGRFFLLENPERSRLWILEAAVQLLNMPGVWSIVLDARAWGAEIDGQMIIKPMRFVGIVPGLEDVIHKRLSAHEKQWCQPIQGALTKKNQEYPDALVNAVLTHLRQVIGLLEAFRFNINKVFAVAEPVKDMDAWKGIFDDVEKTLQSKPAADPTQ